MGNADLLLAFVLCVSVDGARMQVEDATKHDLGSKRIELEQATNLTLKTSICYPWGDSPCQGCRTIAGQKACRKTSHLYKEKVKRVYDDVKGAIMDEKHSAEKMFKEGSAERSEWRKSVACRLAVHAGVFGVGKAACFTLLSAAVTPMCAAVTAGAGALACTGATGMVCNAITTKVQLAYGAKGGAQATCDTLGFPNPLPASKRAFPLKDLGETLGPDQADDFWCTASVPGGVRRFTQSWYEAPDGDCECPAGHKLMAESEENAEDCVGSAYDASMFLNLHCRCVPDTVDAFLGTGS